MTMCHTKWPDLIQYYQTDRQTDILLTEKVITDLFAIQIKEIYVGPSTCIYKIVNLVKS